MKEDKAIVKPDIKKEEPKVRCDRLCFVLDEGEGFSICHKDRHTPLATHAWRTPDILLCSQHMRPF